MGQINIEDLKTRDQQIVMDNFSFPVKIPLVSYLRTRDVDKICQGEAYHQVHVNGGGGGILPYKNDGFVPLRVLKSKRTATRVVAVAFRGLKGTKLSFVSKRLNLTKVGYKMKYYEKGRAPLS